MPFEIDDGRFRLGQSLYAGGTSVREIAALVNQHHRACEVQGADWKAEERAGKSLMLGFVEGLVGDIRKIAGGARGGGQRA